MFIHIWRAARLMMAVAAVATTALAVATTAGATPAVPHMAAAAVQQGWQFPVPGWTKTNKEAGRVDDVMRVGNVVFIAGNFVTAADHTGDVQPRSYLAAEDATTGALLPFAPQLNGRAYFLAASPDHTTLYVGGAFTTVNGHAQPRLVAFDIASGRVSPIVPNLALNSSVKAIAATGSDLYIGGGFTTVSGEPRNRLAKLTLSGGRFALDSTWRADASDEVRDLVADPLSGRLIVAGWFTSLDGSTSSGRLGAVTLASGGLATWASHPGYEVLDIARCGPELYAAMGGPGGTALAFDLATGRQRWYYKTDGNVQAVATVGGYPVYGMHGDYVAPQANVSMKEYGTSKRISRHKVFMLSPDGVLQSWAPPLTSTQGVLGVWALRGGGGSMYVGGDFTRVDGGDQARFAIFPRV
jgi:outer membrane protein assembly factor BamB